MPALHSYYLFLRDARGEVLESFAPAPLSQLVVLAAQRVADFDAYQTVWRVLKQNGGLYARPFLPPPPPPVVKGKRKQLGPVLGPLVVHIVSAQLYHVEHKPA